MRERYEFIRPLEPGPDLRVYLAADKRESQSPCVVTLLRGDLNPDSTSRELEEAFDHRRSLRHSRLIPVRDLAFRGRRIGVVAPFFPMRSGRRPQHQAARLARELAELLDFLHRRSFYVGLLRPSQIMVGPGGWLLNLLLPSHFHQQPGADRSSLCYAAPELIQGGKQGPRSDLYSLGLLLYWIWTGRHPFAENDIDLLQRKQELAAVVRPRKVNPDMPAQVEELILELTRKRIELRPSSAADAVAALGGQEVPGEGRLRSPLVGREAELAQFENALSSLAQARRGTSFLVFSGPSGIGKSRLLARLRLKAQIARTTVADLGHRPGGLTLGKGEGLPTASFSEKAGLETLLEASDNGGLVIFAEDLHRLSEAELRSCRVLSAQTKTPVLVVGTSTTSCRDSGWQALEQELRPRVRMTFVELTPLAQQEVDRLSHHLLGARPSADLSQLIRRTCNGNPLYVREFLRVWRQERRLLFDDGHCYLNSDASEVESVPKNLIQHTERLFRSVRADQRRALSLLALTGGPISSQTWSRLADSRPAHLQETLRALQRLDLLESSGAAQHRVYRISHPWLRKVIQQNLTPQERRRHHRRLARAFELELAETGNPLLAEAVVEHALKANDLELAASHLEKAIAELESQTLFFRAARLLSAATSRKAASLDDWRITQKLVKLLFLAGRHNRCLTLIRRRLNRTPQGVGKAELFHIMTSIHLNRGQYRRAASSARKGLAALKDRDELEQQGRLQAQLLTALTQSGPPAEAERAARSARRLARTRCSARGRLSQALSHFFFFNHDNPAKTFGFQTRALRLAEELGSSQVHVRRLNLAGSYLFFGELERAGTLIQASLGHARRTGNADTEAFARTLDCSRLRLLGRHQEAAGRIRHLLRWREIRDNPILEGSLFIDLGRNYNQLLLLDSALRMLDRAESCRQVRESTPWRVELQSVRAQTLMLLGRYSQVASIAFEAGTFCAPGQEARLRLVKTEAFLALGCTEEAQEQCKRALRKIPDRMCRLRIGAWLVWSRVELARGRKRRALRCARAALAVAHQLFQIPVLAEAHAQVAEVLSASDRYTQSRRQALLAVRRSKQVERPLLQARALRLLGRASALSNHPLKASYGYALALRILRERAFRHSPRNRRRFTTFLVDPIRSERDQLTVSGALTDQTPYLQRVQHFLRELGDASRRLEWGRRLVELTSQSLPGVAASLLVANSDGEALRVVASLGDFPPWEGDDSCEAPSRFHVQPWGADRTQNGDRPWLDLPLQRSAGSQTILRLTVQNGDLTEEQFDFLNCLRAAVALSPVKPSEVWQQDPSTNRGFPLRDGRILIGASDSMRQLFKEVRLTAPSGGTVLILGESGTGKELFARALHDHGPRSDQRFVAVNCSAFPEQLIENELFGHVRGSYTGALRDRSGLVEAASGGTLFLDEISSMPLGLQSRLLRVLEEKSVRRVGETQERRVDIRVVAAANPALEEQVERGEFRADLYYRLNVHQLRVPPLRERLSDLPLLVEYFLENAEQEGAKRKRLTSAAMARLAEYDFPGNVRELQNTIESLCLSGAGASIRREMVDQRLALTSKSRTSASGVGGDIERLAQDLHEGQADFWNDVRDPFLNRDLCRREVRQVISHGLAASGGSYRRLLDHFRLPKSDYRRVLAFLSHHDCKVDFRPFRKK